MFSNNMSKTLKKPNSQSFQINENARLCIHLFIKGKRDKKRDVTAKKYDFYLLDDKT